LICCAYGTGAKRLGPSGYCLTSTRRNALKTTTLIVGVTSTLALTLLAGSAAAVTVTLSSSTDLNTGTSIPTDAGTFAWNTSGPYVYYIDNNPGSTAQETLVDFDLGTNDLNNTGDTTQGVQINADNVSSGGGGVVAFSRNGDGVAGFDLQATGTIILPSVIVQTTQNSVNADSGPITLAGTSVTITNEVSTTPRLGTANEGVGVAKPITITASTGDVILGDVKAGGQRGGGNVSITAAGVIDADTIEAWAGGVNYFSGTVTLSAGGGDITVDDIITGLGGGKAQPITINAPSGDVLLDAIKEGGWRQGSDITITAAGVISVVNSVEAFTSEPGGVNNPGGKIRLTANGGDITLGGDLDTHRGSVFANDIVISAPAGNVDIGGFVSTDSIRDSAPITITADGYISIGGDILASPDSGVAYKGGIINLTAANGPVTVGGFIDVHAERNVGSVTISGTSVSINGTDGSGISVYTDSRNDTETSAGATDGNDINITATSGDVTIAGGLDLSSGLNGPANNEGDLTISAVNGSIILGALDFDLMHNVTLDAGLVTVTGDLLSANLIGGVSTDSFFSVTSDVLYDKDVAANNYLSGSTYDIWLSGSESQYDLRPLPTAAGVIPEPSTLLIWALGLLGLGLYGRRRR